MSALEDRLKQAIDASNFNVLEMTGFQAQPRLALLAGAAVGFRLALDDMTAILEYVDAKVALIECMQQHFRRLCTRCRKYDHCAVYARYIDAWMKLQDFVKKVGK